MREKATTSRTFIASHAQLCDNVRVLTNQRECRGPTFRRLREDCGVSLQDLVTATRTDRDLVPPRGLSHGHIRQWERGHRGLSLWAAHRLAEALSHLSGRRVTIDDFSEVSDAIGNAAA